MDTPEELRHKVKEINNLYRTALMNRKYYAHRLITYNRWNKALEIVVAVGSSAAIASWGIWKLTSASGAVWGVISALGALLAIVKPILQLPKEIERYSKRHMGYCSLYYDLEEIIKSMQRTKTLTPSNWKTFEHLSRRNGDLGIKDELKSNEKLLKESWEKVMQELPKGSLWLPLSKPKPSLPEGETSNDT